MPRIAKSKRLKHVKKHGKKPSKEPEPKVCVVFSVRFTCIVHTVAPCQFCFSQSNFIFCVFVLQAAGSQDCSNDSPLVPTDAECASPTLSIHDEVNPWRVLFMMHLKLSLF